MADFAAILKKTLDKMGETTPETRGKVYEKARQTVQRQIDAMSTRPPQAAIDRQFAKLDEAIAGIEAGYAGTAPEAGLPDREPDLPEEGDLAPEAAPTMDADPSDAQEPQAPPVIEPEAGPAAGPAPEPADETPPASASEPGAVTAPADDSSGPEAPDAEPLPEDGGLDAEPGLAGEPAADRDPIDEPALLPEDETTVDDVLASFGEFDADRSVPAGADGDRTGADADQAEADAHDPLLDFLNEESATLSGEGRQDDEEAERAADVLFGEAGEATSAAGQGRTPTDGEDAVPVGETRPLPEKEGRGTRWGLLAAAAVVLALLAGGGYAAYTNQEPIRAFLADYGVDLPAFGTGQLAEDDDGIPVRTVDTVAVTEAGDETGEEVTAEAETPETPAEAEPETVNAGDNGEQVEKFTQRLTEDGREVDEGPATGAPGPGEGSTIAGQSDTPPPAAEAGQEGADTETAADDGPAIGQRTIFYEERTGTQPGTAMQGSTVWSVTQESPGGDLPLEPAIRAQSSIPDLGLTLDMIIRRNGDATFPASHIVELFFDVPDTFEGRGIADVQRITFKETEQDPGSALIAVPAPIDTNIFLVALTDAATAVQTNRALMQSQGWIDIPMQYVSGRRALITLEKGAAGEEVFDEVFAYWEENPLDTPDGG